MTIACLKNIRAYTSDYELIVVQSLKNAYPNVKHFLRKEDTLLTFEGNLSQPASLNLAISKAKGEYICLMSNDVFVHNYGWLNKIIDCLNNSNVSFIGLAVDRMSQSELDRFRKSWEKQNYIANTSFVYICLQGTTFKKSTYDEIGPFDENLPFYCWDKDYNLRAAKLGKSFGVCIDAQATSLLNMTYIDAGELPEKVNNYWSNESSKKEHEYFQKKYAT